MERDRIIVYKDSDLIHRFPVSFSISRWLRQVELVPHLDRIVIGLDSFLWIDPTRNEDEIMSRPDMTTNQLKKTITRYHLLSWTLCLSRMSTALHKIFQNEVNYYNKGLLTEREFNSLCCRSRSESWIEKWTAPLLCINKLENSLSLDGSKLIKVSSTSQSNPHYHIDSTSHEILFQSTIPYHSNLTRSGIFCAMPCSFLKDTLSMKVDSIELSSFSVDLRSYLVLPLFHFHS